jgi:hypothetical protein
MFEIIIPLFVWAMGIITGLGLGTALASQRFDKERTEWMDC